MSAHNTTSSLPPVENLETMPANYNMGKDQGSQEDLNGSKGSFKSAGVYENLDTRQNGTYPQKGPISNGVVDVPTTVPPDKNGGEDEEKKKEEKPPMVGIAELFRFATGRDTVVIFFGLLFACLHGAAMPVMIIVFGNMSDTFVDNASLRNQLEKLVPILYEICMNFTQSVTDCENITVDYLAANPEEIKKIYLHFNMSEEWDQIEGRMMQDFMNNMTQYCIYYAIIGAAVLLFGYLQMLTWCTAAYNQSQRIRTTLFRSILRQEIGWFDVHEIGELNTRLNDDVSKIELGIGEKLALFFQWFAAFIVGFIVGFVYGWKLTLVIVSVSPLLALCGVAMGMSGTAFTKKELAAYAKAGDIAQEALGAIRTVVAFGGQKKESARYNVNLLEARDFGIKKGMINGLAMGGVFLVMFSCYSLAFWYGSGLVRTGEYTAGDLLIVFFSVLIGAFSLGNAAPNVQEFFNARGAAYTVYNIIDLIPSIDSSSPDGAKLERVQGNVQFNAVHFNYPSRESVEVLKGLSLRVDVGQTVALVGSSGCGKSTVVQLIQRFYDPLQGTVFVDGTDIRTLNVEWLRQQIGVVSQEPILFGCSIAQNISYGQKGCSMEDIKNAAVNANAADFIDTLPDKYETLVGERGAQLSGGQKQRIAIARALVRNPKILLLDEATSALDTESEATVQAALDKARLGRTTIIVAHRLSTIRTADLIFGIRDGLVVESGSHEALMKQGGVYYQLVTNQQAKAGAINSMEEENDYMELDDVPLKYGEGGLDRQLSDRGSLRKVTRALSSASIKAGDKDTQDDDEEKPPEPSMWKIMKLNQPEWLYITVGCFCAIVAGAIQPSFAIIFSELMGVFALTDMVEMERQSNLYSLLFLVLGILAGVSMLGLSAMFSKSGEMLTERVRQLSFKTMLSQDIEFFDDHKNNTGALCTRLSTDASAVQGATGVRLSTFFQSIASVGAGIVIGFIYSWHLTLLVLAFIPFMMAAGVIQMKVISGNAASNKQAMESAGKVAVEALENIRTVATLTKEDKFQNDYRIATEVPFKQNSRKAHLQGAAYGFSQGVVFFAYAAAFYLGAYLVENRMVEYQNVFKVLFAIVFGALSAGQASSFAPDYGKAKMAAGSIFQLMSREPAIRSDSEEGVKMGSVSGSIELNDVCFTYPSRKDTEVLKGVSLRVEPGQRVALVGSSGCGKSTTVQLLERFYDPSQGTVTLDGQALPSLHIQWLRSQMGIVSQEPVLFDYSIRDNIAYGDNSREVSMQEVQEAAMKSNIHSFITSLPEGYETRVGDKGTQLSGGQKQRVAIARALVRNPKILLLDEATSALDTESEIVVQEALDRAQEGRTCLVIAHRLSTIRNANLIVVIHKGRIEETGTHAELTAKKGIYYKLNNMQAKS